MVARTTLRLAVIAVSLQLCSKLSCVHSRRESIRGRQERADRYRIGSSSIGTGRPNRDTDESSSSLTSPFVPSNNSGNSIRPNLVLVPQCDPQDSSSYYSNYGTARDTSNGCDDYLQYCDKKYSNLSFNSWNSYVSPSDFYETLGLLYDRCFLTCANAVGGASAFCSMPSPKPLTAKSSQAVDYCSSVTDERWTSELMAHEAEVLTALNNQRNDPSGTLCTRRSGSQVTTGFFPRSSPVVSNPELSCAARIQAKNIVLETLEQNGSFPSNLHKACPSNGICESFSTRMVNAGYPYNTEGFGYIHEVTAAGYNSAEKVVQGWLGSTSGHCSAIVKQESPFVPTEVGIGYYRDSASGMTGHVVLVAQRRG